MAADFLSMTDNKFLADNLLSTDDWDIDGLDGRELDNLFDVEAANFDPDELMNSISADIDLSSLYGPIDPQTILSSNDLPMEVAEHDDRHSDSNSDSGISTLSIKQEPQSPASSHCSENSNDSAFSQKVYTEQWKIDTPPLTPPRDPNDAYTFSIHTSRTTNAVTTSQPLPTSSAIYNMTSDLCTQIKQEPLPANVVNVLNSKIKIQPKPLGGGQVVSSPTVVQQTTKPVTASSKPLVLTAEEFAKLTAQGVLKFQQPPASSSPSVANNPNLTTTTQNSIPVSRDAKLIKRQQRMIKNRESACLSRKRKKEYMSSIEVQLHEFTVENEQLKQENLLLKRQVSDLENENGLLKKGVNISGISRKAATTCVLSVLLLLSLNLTSFSILPNRASRQQDGLKSIGIPQSMVRHGRTLLSYDETQTDGLNTVDAQFTQKYDHKQLNKAIQSLKKNFKSLNEFMTSGGELSNTHALLLLQHLEAFSSCPNYFNKTESQRLANELTGWVLGHKEVRRKESEIKEKRKKKKKVYKPLTKLQEAMKGSLDVPRRSHSPYQVQVFQRADSYFDFLNSINRRDDTFYVVSFKRDHLLLPATAHNKTMRPRMSLVMPAVTLNESMQPSDNHVAMMQIDCEVMDTRLLHVKKSSIPNYAPTSNQTTGSPNEVAQDYSTQQQGHVTQQGQGRGQRLSTNGKRKHTRKSG